MLPNAFVPAPSQRVEGLLLDSCGLLAGPDAASPTNLEPLHHGYPKKSLPVMKCFVTLHENIFSQSFQAKIFPSTTQAVWCLYQVSGSLLTLAHAVPAAG